MNLFDLEAKIRLDSKDYEKGIERAKSKTESFSSFAVAKGQLIADGLKMGAKAFAGFISDVIGSFAEYEQLVGGVDTLFKESSDIVQEYAANAYKTAGMSANDYMRTVTGFSASLLQSLEGDTEKATRYADMAITDMSDNANKMGTSMESIQFAYQGFAKQNYTMLDNLKLGYGGTKMEMERLLSDAEKLAGKKFDISSYADVVEAIHVVQEEMGIAGTTALEASETIEGSLNSLKASWKNLVTGIADDNADIDKLINNFVESVSTAGKNILPRIQIALNGASKLISTIVPIVAKEIPKIIGENLPVIAQAGVDTIRSFAEGIRENSDLIMESAFEVIGVLIGGIGEMMPEIIDTGAGLLTSFLEELAAHPDEVIETSVRIVSDIVSGIFSNLPAIASAALSVITEFVDSFIEHLPEIFTQGVSMVNEIIAGLDSVIIDIIEAGAHIVESIRQGIENAWAGLVSWFNGIWRELFGNRNVNVTVTKNERMSGQQAASGIDYVPRNEFPASLHRGEMVLTSEEARRYREGDSGNKGITIVQNISSVPMTPVQLAAATESYFERARWAI